MGNQALHSWYSPTCFFPRPTPLNGPGFLSDQPAKPSATAHESTCCRPFSLHSKWMIRCTIQLTALGSLFSICQGQFEGLEHSSNLSLHLIPSRPSSCLPLAFSSSISWSGGSCATTVQPQMWAGLEISTTALLKWGRKSHLLYPRLVLVQSPQ